MTCMFRLSQLCTPPSTQTPESFKRRSACAARSNVLVGAAAQHGEGEALRHRRRACAALRGSAAGVLTGQGLAQAEKPKPACSGSTQQQSLHRQEDGGSTSIRSSCALARCRARTNCAPRASGWLRLAMVAKLHEAPSSRQLRHVEPPGLASSTCSGTRLENEGERGDDHASGGHIDRRNAVLNVPAARRRGAQPQQVAQLAFSMTA